MFESTSELHNFKSIIIPFNQDFLNSVPPDTFISMYSPQEIKESLEIHEQYIQQLQLMSTKVEQAESLLQRIKNSRIDPAVVEQDRKQLAQACQDITELEVRISHLERQNHVLSKDRQDLHNLLDDLRKRNEMLESKLDATNRRNHRLEEQLSDTLKRLDQLEKRVFCK
ncbi:hypothetical protein P9112_008588 [Eukaryota sp. TZLM1-RC]